MSDGKAGRPKIGKQYGIKFPAEEAAYIKRVRAARKLRSFSESTRRIVRDAMEHNRLLESEPTP